LNHICNQATQFFSHYILKKESDTFGNSRRSGLCVEQGSRTRMGGWAVAQSPILGTTITLERLARRGYESMLSYHEKVSPQLNSLPDDRREPLYTRPVAPMLKLRRKHTCSGHAYAKLRQINVRGAPHRRKNPVRPSTRLVAVWPSPHFVNSL